ncbi:MAG: amidohydrolase [Bacteroidales bacterium]|nr:amidohydrolase [Bacteroidales bacterium]MCF8387367.1 amidohydrolase [Bacteroidales bacterium]MCF8397845.1 amidohydrolase [Bacteroidales bacterium]
MEKLKDKIKQLAEKNHWDIVQIRRHIHQHPELSNQEFETSQYVSAILTKFGIEHQTGIFKTGIVGQIKGKNPDKKVTALRADLDALPIHEKNDVEYKSKNEGVMHACGHDVHTSSLLGAARILNEIREHFEGTIKLIFQPAEEKIPGGAKFMIEEGVLENPRVSSIIGQHVFPEMEAGKVGFKTGKYMASSDEITLTIKGRGGHAAMPNRLVDPVLIASHIVVALQQVVSRNADYTIPTVLSFGEIVAEGTYNVIPDEVKIRGTFRTFDEDWRNKAHENISRMARSMAESMGGECDVFIDRGYPFLVNDDGVTENAFRSAQEYLGSDKVVELELRMTGEDFAYFAQAVPACFYRLGTANETLGLTSNLHTSTFDVDEKALETGAGLMAWLAINELNSI